MIKQRLDKIIQQQIPDDLQKLEDYEGKNLIDDLELDSVALMHPPVQRFSHLITRYFL